MGVQKLFISHSIEDADWARSFAKALKERGVTVWLEDFEVKPGESWGDANESALRSSDVLVPLLDGETSSTRVFFFELGAAIAMGKRVVPILARGLDPAVLPPRKSDYAPISFAIRRSRQRRICPTRSKQPDFHWVTNPSLDICHSTISGGFLAKSL